MDSEGEGFYSSSSDATADDSFADYAAVSRLQKPYKILTDDDIRQLFDDDISTVSDVLSVSRGAACTLLCQNNWNLSSVYDKFFAADHRNHQTDASSSSQQELGQNLCKICYDEISPQNTVSAACGHPFCADCWKTYVAAAIDDGAGCLTLRCPEPGCGVAAGVDLIESLASTDGKEKYHRYLRQSYVEASRRRKWCPAPGCNFAVEFDGGGGGGGYDVTCGCSHKFCWNCGEEHHRPVGCETVASWSEKNNSEAENTQWILVYTKPCPKCRRPIEKNQGCNWMTCRPPCLFHFCWLCGKGTGSHTHCNKYGGATAVDENNAKRERARKDLQRYTHYYERWHANEQSRKAAVKDLKTWRDNIGVSKLGEAQGEAPAQLQFVTKAWEQIVECRRVLKWSYAYGYYMEREAPKKVALFEHSQGEAEKQLERLHHCVEKEMGEYLRRRREDFQEFRVRVVDLTVVTGNYFENLVRDLENNRPEVVGGGGGRNGLKKKKDDDERKGLGKKRKKEDDDERNVPRKRATYASRYSRN
ncbi:probable E3 ubiquitin-protein ligase ARI8 [Salvia miltiorrhiza]|uniref:probable E3 ubiquitin-protein ligase ARI8 n=1 Tax=Salvia miltiorrhiza TaxID=226208 RepID=UPI0025AD55BB|nr:probable E3 ubiquitin-protein ligase ARI8 [Salvia miltiorrhiza]